MMNYEKDFSQKGEIKNTTWFAQFNSQIKSHKRLDKSQNSFFRGKHKGQNSFAYLKNKRTYLDKTNILH